MPFYGAFPATRTVDKNGSVVRAYLPKHRKTLANFFMFDTMKLGNISRKYKADRKLL